MSSESLIDAYKFCLYAGELESKKLNNIGFTAEHCSVYDTRDRDFNVGENRLAYVYAHGYNVINVVEKCILNFFDQCLEEEKHYFIHKTNICSLSNGPGFDIVGYLSALYKSKKKLECLPFLKGINLYESWKNMFQTVTSQAYEEYCSGFKLVHTQIPSDNIQFFQSDIFSTMLEGAESCIADSDVSLMVNVFQSTKAGIQVLKDTMRRIFTLLKPGSIMFYIGSKGNVKEVINFISEDNPINVIHGPLKVSPMKVEFNDALVEKIGVKPRQSDTSYFAVFQKKYNCSDINNINICQKTTETLKTKGLSIPNEQLCDIAVKDNFEVECSDEMTSCSKQSDVSNDLKNTTPKNSSVSTPIEGNSSDYICQETTETLKKRKSGKKKGLPFPNELLCDIAAKDNFGVECSDEITSCSKQYVVSTDLKNDISKSSSVSTPTEGINLINSSDYICQETTKTQKKRKAKKKKGLPIPNEQLCGMAAKDNFEVECSDENTSSSKQSDVSNELKNVISKSSSVSTLTEENLINSSVICQKTTKTLKSKKKKTICPKTIKTPKKKKGKKKKGLSIPNVHLCDKAAKNNFEVECSDKNTSSSKQAYVLINLKNAISKSSSVSTPTEGINFMNSSASKKPQNVYVTYTVNMPHQQADSNKNFSLPRSKQCKKTDKTSALCINENISTETSNKHYLPPFMELSECDISSAGNQTQVQLVTNTALPKQNINGKGKINFDTQSSKAAQKSLPVSKSLDHLVQLHKQTHNKDICNDNLQKASSNIQTNVLKDSDQTLKNKIYQNSKALETENKIGLEIPRKLKNGTSQTADRYPCSEELNDTSNKLTFHSMRERCQTLIASIEKLVENINTESLSSTSKNEHNPKGVSDCCTDNSDRIPHCVCSNYTQSCCMAMQSCIKEMLSCMNMHSYCHDMQFNYGNMHSGCQYIHSHCKDGQSSWGNTHLCYTMPSECRNSHSCCTNMNSCGNIHSCSIIQSHCKDMQSCGISHSCCTNIPLHCKDMQLHCSNTNLHCKNMQSHCSNTNLHCKNMQSHCSNTNSCVANTQLHCKDMHSWCANTLSHYKKIQ